MVGERINHFLKIDKLGYLLDINRLIFCYLIKDVDLFSECFKDMLIRDDKLYYNYMGICKRTYPKWAGWKLIKEYKDNGVHVADIHDERLDLLVENFYYRMYIEELMYQENPS